VGEALVEIEGARGDVGLMNPELHRDALDAFGGLEAQADEVRTTHRAWRTAARALEEARAARDASRAEEEYWRHVATELGALDPQPGEERMLAERRSLLMNAGKLVETVNAAMESLSEGTAVESRIAAARRILDRGIQGDARAAFEPVLAALDRAADAAGEAIGELEKASGGLDLDPRTLEKTEERLFALRAAARRHSCAVDALPQLAADFAARIAALEDGGAGLEKLTKEEAATRSAYMGAARVLADGRAKAAAKLDKAVVAELPALRLDKAVFKTLLDPLPEDSWSDHGMERVRFAVATNPGAEPGPIGRIASRGEMSRFLLALRVVLAEAGAVPTLVLDEIDAGVGGATAAAIGERLSRLGRRIQLLVVTHSPQVAACGGTHWRVTKRVKNGATLTQTEALDGDARREEIARMLAGAKITDEARAAADKLMAVKAR
jgi:DNA repair protein RecN (Recombination protein N)